MVLAVWRGRFPGGVSGGQCTNFVFFDACLELNGTLYCGEYKGGACNMDAVVEAEGIVKTYRLGKTEIRALRGVGFQIGRGEFVSIAGPSGSGKTTLLNIIGCIDTPDAGEMTVCGQRISRLSPDEAADLRALHIGFVFQTFNLIPVLTTYENVEYPLLLTKVEPGERRRVVSELLSAVGLAEHAGHRPSELSGGQRQRVAVARALVGDVSLVLADEPTANLDSKTGIEVLDLMHRLNRERGVTFVFSTHDPAVMDRADRLLRISDGLIREEKR